MGLLGPGPVEAHIEHARGFARALREITRSVSPPSLALDLGAGGGLPGMVLLFEWPTTAFVWLDSSERSAEFLESVADRLGASGRVQVVRGRAEDVGRQPAFRHHHDLVVARAFGRPAVTAECAAPFLAPGGHLVVSEPPSELVDRWDADRLALLGLEVSGCWRDDAGYQVLRQFRACPEQYPRRPGRPQKAPLF